MKTIIVGIDGSHAAITAALWGVDEAISRAVPLRLVSVIKPTHPSPDDYDRDLAHAERSLRERPGNAPFRPARLPSNPRSSWRSARFPRSRRRSSRRRRHALKSGPASV